MGGFPEIPSQAPVVYLGQGHGGSPSVPQNQDTCRVFILLGFNRNIPHYWFPLRTSGSCTDFYLPSIFFPEPLEKRLNWLLVAGVPFLPSVNQAADPNPGSPFESFLGPPRAGCFVGLVLSCSVAPFPPPPPPPVFFGGWWLPH